MTTAECFWDQLPAADAEALADFAQRRFLPRGDCLLDRGEDVETVYFPITADISNLMRSADGGTVMSSNVGREGVTGLAAFMARQPIGWDLVVQVEGDAMAVPAEALRARAEQSSELREALLRITHFHQIEASQNTLCAVRHAVLQRVARMFLELHDRTGKTSFEITQDEIAGRLGAQRTTINAAWKTLGAECVVRAQRGKASILDIDALRRRACDCYQTLAASRYWPLADGPAQPVSPSTDKR